MSRRRTSLPIRLANVAGVAFALTLAALGIWAGGSFVLRLIAELGKAVTGSR